MPKVSEFLGIAIYVYCATMAPLTSMRCTEIATPSSRFANFRYCEAAFPHE